MGYRNLGKRGCALCGAQVVVSPRRMRGKPASCPRDEVIGRGLVKTAVALQRLAMRLEEAPAAKEAAVADVADVAKAT